MKFISSKYYFLIYHLCYILGPLFLNFFSLIFLLLNLKFFKKKFYKKLNKKYLIFVLAFLLFLFLNSIKSSYQYFSLVKFLSILNYFIFGYVLYLFLINNDFKKNFYYFSKFSCFIVIFVSLDLMTQYYFGKNFFFMSSPDSSELRFSGIFGKELIAGSYLSYFFLFGSNYLEKKNQYFFFHIFL